MRPTRPSAVAACLLGVLLIGCGGTGRPASQAAADSAPPAPADTTSAIVFFGTSLTAGLGLPAEEAYPAVIQEKLDSAGLRFRAVNAGVSGETSAGGFRRIDWLLRQPVAVLVLELGANDALRGQDLSVAKRNLQEIIQRTRVRYPDAGIIVAGMQAPPNLGRRYTREFRQMFVDLARESHADLIPFLLEGVAGDPRLNQADGLHPTAAGQRIVAENVWRVLEPTLRRQGKGEGGRGKGEEGRVGEP